MKLNIPFYLFFIICSMMLLTQSCEHIKEDTLPDTTDNTGNTEKVFYTFQENDVLITPIQLLNSVNIKGLRIASVPMYGKIEFLDNGYLHYKPNDGVVEADDQIDIEVTKNDATTFKHTIVVKIVPQNQSLPCIISAFADNVKTTENNLVEIDVLKNDHICDATFKDIEIQKNPLHGTAIVQNNKITFTPNAGFKGEDRFLYTITALTTEGIIVKRPAFVQVAVMSTVPTCTTTLRNDNFEVKPQNLGDSIRMDLLANDMICPDDATQGSIFQLSITKMPNCGFLVKLSNNRVIYKPFPPAPMICEKDSFTYQVKVKSGTYTAKVYVIYQKPDVGCKLQASKDFYEVNIKQVKNLPYLDFNVLQNDFLCNTTTKIEKVTPLIPKDTDVKVINNLVRYTPKNGQYVKGDVDFSYEINDNTGKKSVATVKIKFVD